MIDHGPRILSTFANWADMPFWSSRVDSFDIETRLQGSGSPITGFYRRILAAFRLWRISRDYDVVITDASLTISLFGLLHRLPGSRARHLVLECLFERPKGELGRLLKSVQIRAALSRHTRAVIYSRKERQSFARAFGVSPDRFVFIPYHTTLHWYRFSTTPRNSAEKYLFAGGESNRDYPTLFSALDGLDVRAVIAIRNRGVLQGVRIPKNVELITTDHAGFLRWMENAYMNVVSLRGDALRCAGHQTFLNAMAFGTPVIVTDDGGARDYIRTGVDGLVISAEDRASLRTAILRLWQDPSLADRLGEAAKRIRNVLSTERVLTLYLEFAIGPAFQDSTVCEYGAEALGHDVTSP